MNWQSLPERSNRFWILVIVTLTRWLGRPFARLILYPVTAYFLLFNNRTIEASRLFFSRALIRPPRPSDYFRQFHTFACVLIDRMSILIARDSALRLHYSGLECIEDAKRKGNGAVLVGSHLGSFDVLRTFTHDLRGYPVRAIMYGRSTPTLLEILRSLNPRLNEELVLVPGSAALIALAPEIERGAMIGLLGDRVMPGERHEAFEFMGFPAHFPLTPALVAEILEVPLIQFVCLHQGWGRYEVHFHLLSDGGTGSKSERNERIRSITGHYVKNLEHYASRHPYNWFNFHDIWSDPEG